MESPISSRPLSSFSYSLKLNISSVIPLKSAVPPHSVSFLESHGLLILSTLTGSVSVYDMLVDDVPQHLYTFNFTRNNSPIISTVIKNKLILARGRTFGARCPVAKGRLLLDTVFQTCPNDGKDHVTIEVLPEEVSLLLNEFKANMRTIKSSLTSLASEIIGELEQFLINYKDIQLKEKEEKETNHLNNNEWEYCHIKGPLGDLIDIFKSLCSQYQPTKTGSRTDPSQTPSSPVAPILSAIKLRLLLLFPHFTKRIRKLELGQDQLSQNDSSLMYCEGIRRLAYTKWPHKNYVWAEPIKMSQAGLYPLLSTTSTVTSLATAQSKADRVTCFTCGIHLHRWIPTDEPWSEHLRHSPNCPFMKGEFTVNVSSEFTQATHPAVHCTDDILLLSSSSFTDTTGADLLACLTADGVIHVWDVGKPLFIQEHSTLNIYKELNEEEYSTHHTQTIDTPLQATPTHHTTTPIISDYVTEIQAISSLCVVTMTTDDHTPLTNPSLLIGCTVRNTKREIVSAILVYSLSNKEKEGGTSSNDSKSLNMGVTNVNFNSLSLEEEESVLHDLLNDFPEEEEEYDEKDEGKKLLHTPLKKDTPLYKSQLKFINILPLPFSSDETPQDNTHFPIVTNIVNSRDKVLVTIAMGTKTKAGPIANGNQSTLRLYPLVKTEQGCIDIETQCLGKKDFNSYEESIRRLIIYNNNNRRDDNIIAITNDGLVKIMNISLEREEIGDTIGPPNPSLLGISTMKEVISTDANGFPCTVYSPYSWTPLHPLKATQSNPVHMLYKQNETACTSSVLYNTNVWQYVPQLIKEGKGRNKHIFELRFPQKVPPIGSLVIKLKLATSTSLSDTATLTLSYLKATPLNSTDNITLCGPIYVKDYIDITELSLTLSLSHPILLASPPSSLLLTFNDLFNTDDLTKELFSETTPLKIDTPTSNRRTPVRRSLRRTQQAQKPPTILRNILSLTVFSYNGSLSFDKLKDVVPLMFEENVLWRLMLMACGYQLEISEEAELGESLKDVVNKEEREELNALDILCWLSSMACLDNNKSVFTLTIKLISKCITSLLHHCYFTLTSGREVAYKCTQLIILLSRKQEPLEGEPVMNAFRYKLSQAFIRLTPYITTISYSSSLQYYLDLLTHHFTPTCSDDDDSLELMLSLLMNQLIGLSKERVENRDLHYNEQLLMNDFKLDASVFDDYLFDISVTKPHSLDTSSTTPKTTPTNAHPVITEDEFNNNFPPLSSTTTSQTTPTKTPPTCNNSSQLYDSESLLLLEERGKEGVHLLRSNNKNYTSFKNGSSYLLHTQQRGLLETLPLTYAVTSLTSGTSVSTMSRSASGQINVVDPLLTSYLNIHQPIKHLGYDFPILSNNSAHQTTPTLQHSSCISPILANIPNAPEEAWLIIESLKPGTCISTVIDFSQIVQLTDFYIPCNSNISAIKIEAWANEKAETVVMETIECATRSTIIGNLTTPILVRYLRITCIGVNHAASQKVYFSLGQYYRKPHPSDVDHTHLRGVESKLLTQYNRHTGELVDLLSMYSHSDHALSLLHQSFCKQLMSVYNKCYNLQVKLARVRNLHKLTTPALISSNKFNLDDLQIKYSSLSSKHLNKCLSLIVNSLLVLSNKFCPPETTHSLNISQDSARSLFLSTNVYSMPTRCAGRVSSLLVMYVGHKEWWGELLSGLMNELFSDHNTLLFNKERVILQLSILYQLTLTANRLPTLEPHPPESYSPTSEPHLLTVDHHPNVIEPIEPLLKLLSCSLSPLVSSSLSPLIDSQLIQWITVLLSHILSERNNDNNNNSRNIFIPTLLSAKERSKNELAGRIKEMSALINETLQLLNNFGHLLEEREKGRLVKVKGKVDKKKKELEKLTKKLEQEGGVISVDKELRRIDEKYPRSNTSGMSMCPELLVTVIQGLVSLMVKYCKNEDNLDNIPVICKVVIQLISLLPQPLPLDSAHLEYLVTYLSSSSLSQNSTYQWACHSLQTLLVNIALREIELLKGKRRSRNDLITMTKKIQISLLILDLSSKLNEDPLTSDNLEVVKLRKCLTTLEDNEIKCFSYLTKREHGKEEKEGKEEEIISEESSEECDDKLDEIHEGGKERNDGEKEELESVTPKRILKSSKSSTHLKPLLKKDTKTTPLPPPLTTLPHHPFSLSDAVIQSEELFINDNLPPVLLPAISTISGSSDPLPPLPFPTFSHPLPITNLPPIPITGLPPIPITDFPPIPIPLPLNPFPPLSSSIPHISTFITTEQPTQLLPSQLPTIMPPTPIELNELVNEVVAQQLSSLDMTPLNMPPPNTTNTPPTTFISKKYTPLSSSLSKSKPQTSSNSTNTTVEGQNTSHATIYSSSIISNTLDYRLYSNLLLPTQLRLQVIWRDSYMSLLNTMQSTKPLLEREEMHNGEKGKKEEKKEQEEVEGVNITNLRSLLDIFNRTFVLNYSSLSFNLSSFLQLWNEICYVIVKKMSKKHLSILVAGHSLLTPSSVSSLLQILLSYDSTDSFVSPQLIQSFFSLLHLHIKIAQEVNEKKGEGEEVRRRAVRCQSLGLEEDKLKKLLIVYFNINKKEEEGGSDCDVIFGKFVSRLAQLEINPCKEKNKKTEEMKGEKGVSLLLSVLNECLQNKKTSLHISPYISSLFRILHQSTTLRLLQAPTYNTLHIISSLTNTILYLLIQSCTAHTSFVRLWGGVNEGDKNRRYYYSSSSSQEMKWIQMPHPSRGHDSALLVELMKILKKILSLSVPLIGESITKLLCNDSNDHTHDISGASDETSKQGDLCDSPNDQAHLQYAVNDKPLIELILRNDGLLLEILQTLSYVRTNEGTSGCVSLLKDFVTFLRINTLNFSCFHTPLIKLMETSSIGERKEKGECHSMHIVEMCKEFISNNNSKEDKKEKRKEKKSKEKENKRKGEGTEIQEEKKIEKEETSMQNKKSEEENQISFITKGGGLAVIKCLILSTISCKVTTPTDHTFQHAVTSLGLQEVPLPYKEGSHLINFFSKATVRATPGNPSLKDLQGVVNLKDQPGRSSALQYNYQKDVNWLKIIITLDHPIVLNSIHLYQPAGSTQNGPSLVKVQVIRPSNLGEATPLAPLLRTTGLTGIRIEMTSHVIVKEVWLSLHRPAVSDNLLLSNLLLLGTIYGSGTREEEGNLITTIPHISEGWLHILNDWTRTIPNIGDLLYTSVLSVNEEVTSQLVNSCVTLMQYNMSPLALKQLHSFLLFLSSHSHDIGHQLVLLLFKAQFTMTTPTNNVAMVTKGYIVQSLLDLLSLNNIYGHTRLVSVLKLLSQILIDKNHTSSTLLSPMIRVLANVIWNYKPHPSKEPHPSNESCPSDNSELCVIDGLTEEIFNSFLNITYSTDTNSPLKTSLNSLLTSLCQLHPKWFTIALQTAHTALIDTSSYTNGNILQSLAHFSLSNDCIDQLLTSTLLSDIISDLVNTIVSITLQSQLSNSLRSICTILAFLTDLAFGHTRAQAWLVTKDHTSFWPLLMKLFNEPSHQIFENQLIFCQRTLQQFFSVCIKSCQEGKQLFINLLLNSLVGLYSIDTPSLLDPKEDASINIKITPFIKTLIMDHLLGPEAVHLILKIEYDLLESNSEKFHLESLVSTYDSPHYHPSYPLSNNCYYFKVSSEYKLSKLLGLILSNDNTSVGNSNIKNKGAVKNETTGAKDNSTNKSSHNIFDIFNPQIIYTTNMTSMFSNSRDDVCLVSEEGSLLSLNMSVSELCSSTVYGCAYTRVLNVTSGRLHADTLSPDATSRSPSSSPLPFSFTSLPCSSLSLIELFAECDGLIFLSHFLPLIHSGHWSVDIPLNDTITLDMSSLPLFSPASFLPPHSYVMLSLGMSLKEYGQLLSESRINGWVLLKGVFGATEDIEKHLSSSYKELLSALPFIYLLIVLQRSSVTNQKGRDLIQQVYSAGIIHHVLSCLSKASHISPRKKREDERGGVMSKEDVADKKNELLAKHKTTPTSSGTSSNEYWAKGTGFGTGSTSSNWDMSKMMSQHKSDELLVSVCLAIMGAWLNIEEEIKEEREEEEGIENQEEMKEEIIEEVKEEMVIEKEKMNLSDEMEIKSDEMEIKSEIIDKSEERTKAETRKEEESNQKEDTIANELLHQDNTTLIDSSEHSSSTEDNTNTSTCVSTIIISSSNTQNESLDDEAKSTEVELNTDTDSSTVIATPIHELLVESEVYSLSLLDVLRDSCLLPVLAHYISNDSILDISKHTQVYKSIMLTLLSLASNPVTQSLLFINIHETNDHTQSIKTLATLLKHLNHVAMTYNKTIGQKKNGSSKANEKTSDSKKSPSPQVPINDNGGDNGTELSEVIALILKCGEMVSLQEEGKELGVEPTSDSTDSDNNYMETMKPLQFDTYVMTQPDPTDSNKLIFTLPYHYSSRVIESIDDTSGTRGRRLAQEVATLVTSLPLSSSSSVFVRCDEERLDVMKVLITGPSDTPYSNGCFIFDVYFPPDYPTVPMCVNLCTTGQGTVRFNPNLYNDGKVCLSVLNTWHGRPEEKWNSSTSSFLQVLVSIQSLILVSDPYFNEPGYEQHRGTPFGNVKSLTYNANICVATVQWAMIDLIRNPPDCFKQIILKHFYLRRHEIFKDIMKWKKEITNGIHKHSMDPGTSVQLLKNHLINLVKQYNVLKSVLAQINPSDFNE